MIHSISKLCEHAELAVPLRSRVHEEKKLNLKQGPVKLSNDCLKYLEKPNRGAEPCCVFSLWKAKTRVREGIPCAATHPEEQFPLHTVKKDLSAELKMNP